MTQEELKEYNDLTPEQKDMYNMGMRHHPEWAHNQALTYAIICANVPTPPDNKPEGETLKDIFEQTLARAQEFIRIEFPRIYTQVKESFKKAIGWLTNAVNVTLNRIIDFFN